LDCAALGPRLSQARSEASFEESLHSIAKFTFIAIEYLPIVFPMQQAHPHNGIRVNHRATPYIRPICRPATSHPTVQASSSTRESSPVATIASDATSLSSTHYSGQLSEVTWASDGTNSWPGPSSMQNRVTAPQGDHHPPLSLFSLLRSLTFPYISSSRLKAHCDLARIWQLLCRLRSSVR
jgi:hypothetical protein